MVEATTLARSLVEASAAVRGDLTCEELAILLGLAALPEPAGRSELASSIGMSPLTLVRCLRSFPLGETSRPSGDPLIRETSPNEGLTMLVFLTDAGKVLAKKISSSLFG